MQDPRQHRGAAETPQLWEAADGAPAVPRTTRRARSRLRQVVPAAEPERPKDLAPSAVDPVPRKHPEPVLLLSVEEAARALGIGRSKTYELISAGDLETVHIGRSTRVPVAALHDLLDRLREAGERSRMRHCTKGRAADRAVDAEAEGEGRTVTETGAQP